MGGATGQTNRVQAPLTPDDPTLATLTTLTSALAVDGLDLVCAGPLEAYHRAIPTELRLPFPNDQFPPGPPEARGGQMIVLVGASRALWSAFQVELARNTARRQAEHPLDGWLAPRIQRAAAAAFAGQAYEVYHYWEPPPRRVALQHLAEALGLAGRAPCGLVIHPTLGLWLSLRAAIVVDLRPPAMASHPPWPCATCADKPCVPALERALAVTPATGDHAGIRQSSDAWIAVRDACPVGREHRYTEAQLRWHYRHDRQALLETAP